MNRAGTCLRGLMCACVLGAAGAWGQDEPYELGGYVKYLFTGSTPPSGDARYDHLVHGRLNARWFPTADISAVAEVRVRGFYGGSVRATPHFTRTLEQDGGFGTMGVTLWDGPSTAGYAQMDRLYLNASTGAWQFTVGRQRIAWGTNLVWNTVDLFNPQSVLDFDYDEKPPVDGFRVQYYTGELSKIEFAFTPGPRRHPTFGAQWTFNTQGYDIHLLAGVRDHGAYGGFAWAGDIAGGGFRGELLVADYDDNHSTHEEVALYGSASLHPYAGAGTMVAAALSGDYTFPNSFYVHTELLYNDEGVTEMTQLNAIHASHLGMLSPARWSLFQEFSYDISPLVRGGLFAIYNPTDHSSVVFPSLTWSVITDLDLSVLALLFSGDAGTEYGAGGTAVVARLKWSW